MPKKRKTKKLYEGITKQDFLKIMTSMDRDQIHELIMSKGKEPKLIAPMMILK